MFSLTIKYLGFLKFIPGLPHLFDVWLKVCTFVTKPALLDWMDSIKLEAVQWQNVNIKAHKYGGMQFNYGQKEIGHIHGNGLLDMLLSRQMKQQLIKDGRIQHHHYFKDTGWISFWIRTDDDKQYAIQLLQMGYNRLHA